MRDGMVELLAGPAHLLLAPALGGRITALALAPDGEGAAREVLAPFPEDTAPDALFRWPKGGLYPLIPYGNRVRDARLLFDGSAHRLPPHPDAAPHSLHGHAHRAAWRLGRRAAASAELEVEHDGTGEWPWRFAARLALTLSPGTLAVRVALCNTDHRPAPAGVGLHPYLLHHPGDRIGFRAATAWPTTPDNLAGPPVPATDGFDPPRPLPPGEASLYRGGWDGRCSVLFRDGTALRLRADASFGHLVVYRPASAAYLCVEPCSHAPDGFNLAEHGIPGAGRVTLAPGETLSGHLSITLRRKRDGVPAGALRA